MSFRHHVNGGKASCNPPFEAFPSLPPFLRSLGRQFHICLWVRWVKVVALTGRNTRRTIDDALTCRVHVWVL